jgi:hypothetical protein
MKSLITSAALALALASCQSSGSTDAVHGDWLEASPRLADRIEDQVKRLPWSHGQERIELIHWFASVGEPAYETLLALCLDNRPDVAGSAVAALGASGDSRLVTPLHGLEWPEGMHAQVRYERARAYLRLGDWSEIGVLIDGLEGEEVWTRAWCAQALEEVTHQRYGFKPQGSEAERAESVRKWRDWMAERRAEGILVSRG